MKQNRIIIETFLIGISVIITISLHHKELSKNQIFSKSNLMKKTITFLLLLVAIATTQAQTNIPLTNGDCSTDASLSGSSPYIITSYTIAVASPAILTSASSGITGGQLKVIGTVNGSAQGNVTITTDKVDISSYPVDATFTYACKMTCGTATSQAQPYNVIVIAYAADGITVVTANTLTLTKVQPNTNVNAGVAQTIGATAVMKANAVTPGLDAKYISFQLQMGKMITNNLTFDDFTLTKLDVAPATITGTPSNSALSYEVGFGPSAESSFTVSGTGLGIDAIVLTPGTNLEISLTSGSGFVANPSTINLTPTSGTVSSTTIYTRLISGINGIGTAGSAASTRVTVFHNTAGTKTVQFTGTVNGLAISNPVSTSIGYVQGNGPSSEQTFNVSGSGLTTDLVVTPGANMEISTTTGSGFASTPITLTQTAGTVAATPIYARLIAGLTTAIYNDATTKVTASSIGFTSKELQFVGTVDVSTKITNSNSTNYKCVAANRTIKVIGVEAGKRIEIFNSVGQKVKSIIATDNDNIILSAGIYVVKVNTFVQKVVLK